jgi:hypothetical protein
VGTRQREREILEKTVHAIAERARDAYELIEEIEAAGLPADGPTMLAAKRLRMLLLQTKGELERELMRWAADCRRASGHCIGSRGSARRPGIGPTRSRLLPGITRSSSSRCRRSPEGLPQGPVILRMTLPRQADFEVRPRLPIRGPYLAMWASLGNTVATCSFTVR